MGSSPAVAVIAVLAFSMAALSIVGGFFGVFDRAWMARMADRRRADDRLLQARQAWRGMWGGVGAVAILVLALIFVVPSVRDSAPLAWVVGGSRGAWVWGIVLLAVATAVAAADVLMTIRISRSMSRGLPDPTPNRLPWSLRWTGVALFGVFGIIAVISAGTTGWLART